MLKELVAAAFLFVAGPQCFAQTAPSSPGAVEQQGARGAVDALRLTAARRVVLANGSANSLSFVITRMVPQLVAPIAQAQGLSATESANATRILTEEMQATSGDMVDAISEIYARHMSADDLNALADFYESPPGRRYIGLLPTLLEDSMQAGRAWAQTILLPRIEARVQALKAQGQLENP